MGIDMIDNKIVIIAIIFVVMYLLYQNNCSINEGFKLENELGNNVMEHIKDNSIKCKCRCNDIKPKIIGGNPETWTPGSRIHHHQEEEHNIIGGNPNTWSPGASIGGNPETWTPDSKMDNHEENSNIVGGNPCTWSPGSKIDHHQEQEHNIIGADPETWTPGSKIEHMQEQENKINPRCFSIEKEGDIKGYYKMAPKKHNYISKIDGSTIISKNEDDHYNICHTCDDGTNCNCNEET